MCSELPLQFCPPPFECWWGSTVYTVGWLVKFSHCSPLLFQTEAAGLHGAYVV